MWAENSLAVRPQCRLSSLDVLQTILGLLPLICSELLDPGDVQEQCKHAEAPSLSACLLIQRYNEFGVVRLEWNRCCWNCEPNQQFPGIANQEGSTLCSEHSTEAVRTKHHWNCVGNGHSLCCNLPRTVVKEQPLTSVKWLQAPRQVLGACDSPGHPLLAKTLQTWVVWARGPLLGAFEDQEKQIPHEGRKEKKEGWAQCTETEELQKQLKENEVLFLTWAGR